MKLLSDTASSYPCREPTNPERPKGGTITTTEVLEEFLDEVMDERIDIETEMKTDRGGLDQSYRSFLQGKLEYNGQLQTHIRQLMAQASK